MISLAPLFAAAFGLIAYKRSLFCHPIGSFRSYWWNLVYVSDGIGHLSFTAIVSALSAPLLLELIWLICVITKNEPFGFGYDWRLYRQPDSFIGSRF